MDKRLEEIQGKFDIVQEVLKDEKIFDDNEYCEMLVNLLGSMIKHTQKLIDPFEIWYEKMGEPFLDYVKDVFDKKRLNSVNLNKEDLEILYEYLRQNVIQEYRRRNNS